MTFILRAAWAVVVTVIMLAVTFALLAAAAPLVAVFLGILYALVTGGD